MQSTGERAQGAKGENGECVNADHNSRNGLLMAN